jgi:parvulin-like peptidyl-prolyl isomerase
MTRNITLNTVTLILALAFGCAFSSHAQADDKDVVAVAGTKSITVKDFNERYNEVAKKSLVPPSKDLFLEDLIRYEIGVQEAVKRGIPDEAVVKERIRQEYYKGLIEKELGQKISEIKVTDKEMQDWYKDHPEIRSSHILIEFRPEATADQKKAAKDRAQEILSEVKKSKRPFEELVGLYTDDVLSKRTGGDVGWQSRVTLAPSYYDAISKMKVGDVSGLIETQYGYHIIKVTGRRGYGDADKRAIRAGVYDEKRNELFNAYFVKLKKQYTVKINKGALK